MPVRWGEGGRSRQLLSPCGPCLKFTQLPSYGGGSIGIPPSVIAISHVLLNYSVYLH